MSRICQKSLYLLMGAVGLPVFAGYSAGFSRFAGAGGGYLTGYLFLVPFVRVMKIPSFVMDWDTFGLKVL